MSEEEKVEPVEAMLDHGRVYLPLTDKVKDLREKGFGELKRNRVYLSPTEALYLLDKKKIIIRQNEGKELSLSDLIKKLSDVKDETWIKYLIYRDLRDRGYIVRETSKFDFEVYGKGALRRLVSIVHEGGDTSIARLNLLLSHAKRERKELVLAVIDRRTDIVYYTLDSLTI